MVCRGPYPRRMDPILLNSPTVKLKSGAEHKGASGKIFLAADSTPTLVQVRKLDHFVTIPVGEVAEIVSV